PRLRSAAPTRGSGVFVPCGVRIGVRGIGLALSGRWLGDGTSTSWRPRLVPDHPGAFPDLSRSPSARLGMPGRLGPGRGQPWTRTLGLPVGSGTLSAMVVLHPVLPDRKSVVEGKGVEPR